MEIKELRDEILSTYEELKKRYDKQEEEIKNFGKASHETKTAIENLNKNLDELKSRLDEMETKMNRPPVGEEHKADIMKKAFFRWVREGKAALEPEERKALVEDTAGQILVPEALEKELYRELPKITVVRGLATVRPTTSNRIRRGSLTEVAVGWGKLETGATVTDSMPSTPTEAFIYIEDLYGLAKIGEDELMDTDVNLQAYLVDSFSRKIAEAEDTAFIKGTGHANEQPEGILNGTTVTRVTAGQTGAIIVDDVLDLVYAVPAQYRKNSVFIMNSMTERAIRKLKDSNGQYLWQPAVAAGRPNAFLGYPIFNQEDVPEIPAAGVADDVMIFGDIKSGYAIFDRLGITIQRLNELYAESGLVGFKVHFRAGGGVVRANALRILNVPAV